MAERISVFFNLIKKNKFKSVIAVLLAVFVFWFIFAPDNGGGIETHIVQNGPLTEEVSVTGRIKPVSDITMAFEKTGRIARVSYKVGDRVGAGGVIANLDLSAPLSKVNEEKARLEQLKRGSRPEEIAVKQADLDKSKKSLQAEYDNVFDVLNDSLVKSEDSVRVKTSGIFSGNSTSGYQLTFSACDAQIEINAEALRAKSNDELNNHKKEVSSLAGISSPEALESALIKVQAHLLYYRELLENISFLLNQSCSIDNSSLDTYRTNIGTARTNVATAITNVSEMLSDISVAKATVSSSESALALSASGGDPEDIKAQEAKVGSAEADLRTYSLISPINGIITKQDAKVGEIAYTNTELVSIISDGAYEIEVNVPELDITRLKEGDKARITLDAYGPEASFEGIVASIDPAETLVHDIPTYKISVTFIKKDERIKSGLTANVYITTENKESVLSVPARAIRSNGGKKYLVVKTAGGEEKREVTLGIRGNSGEVEVISGVQAGEEVIIPNAQLQ